MAWHRQDVRQFVLRTGTGCFQKVTWPQREKRRKWQSPTQKKKTKQEEQDPKEEKCGWGPNCPLCKAQKKEANPPHQQEPIEGQQQQKPLSKLQATRPDTLNMTKRKQQWEQEM